MATLTVRGHGVADVEPSRVEVRLVLTAMSPTAGEAYTEVAARAAALADLLDELAIPAADRITEGLALHEEPTYPDVGQPRSAGYRAWSRTRVRLRDVDAMGRLIGRAIDGAKAGIDGVYWHVDTDDPAWLEACRRAADSARERAQAYADALGTPLGQVISALEAGTVAGAPADSGRMRAIAVAAPALPIDLGTAQVSATVDVTYELGTDTRG